MQSPSFNTPINIPIQRFQSDEIYFLQSVDVNQNIKMEDLETIVSICSESLIYDVLFKERLKASPYLKADAQKFINWAKEGWSKNEWFVFLIRDSKNKIVGAVDIKSNNLESAEVGYWITKTVSGVMTNAVLALCDLAKVAGYKSLYGLTVLDNIKSQNVLIRSGFVNKGQIEEKGKHYLKFIKEL